jgi:branched-subunit amino acid ABC-type transport system permease component
MDWIGNRRTDVPRRNPGPIQVIQFHHGSNLRVGAFAVADLQTVFVRRMGQFVEFRSNLIEALAGILCVFMFVLPKLLRPLAFLPDILFYLIFEIGHLNP